MTPGSSVRAFRQGRPRRDQCALAICAAATDRERTRYPPREALQANVNLDNATLPTWSGWSDKDDTSRLFNYVGGTATQSNLASFEDVAGWFDVDDSTLHDPNWLT